MAPSILDSAKEILSLNETAELLGVNKRTLSRWIGRARQPLPVSRPPGARRALVLRSRLFEWLRLIEEPAVGVRKSRAAARRRT